MMGAKAMHEVIRTVVLYSESEEKGHLSVRLKVLRSGSFKNRGALELHLTVDDTAERRKKASLRSVDRTWVYRNIPSSITWETEIHHDWEDGGRMYLLTKGEHILRHRRVK